MINELLKSELARVCGAGFACCHVRFMSSIFTNAAAKAIHEDN
jgi:hypothetical protein